MTYVPLTLADIDAWTNDTDTSTGNMFDVIKDEQDRIHIRWLIERFLIGFNDILARWDTKSAVILVRTFLDVFLVLDWVSTTLRGNPLRATVRNMLKERLSMKIQDVDREKIRIGKRTESILTLEEIGNPWLYTVE